jgi:predicted ATP-grasp superfamily ATP-dependent carboligase
MNNVIIIGTNYSSTLGLARSLGEAGYGVRLLALTKGTAQIVGRSKYVNKTLQVEFNFFEEDSAEEEMRALEELRGDDEKILIIPCRDITCMMLEKHWDRLSEHFYFPNISGVPGELNRFSNKAVQKELAEKCGLKTAGGGTYSTDEAGINRATQEVSFPCFMKPLSSSWTLSEKKFVTMCSNAEELRAWMGKAKKDGACEQVLLERYLKIDQELSAYGVAANGQVWLPAVVRVIRNGLGTHVGVAAEGEVMSSDVLGESRERIVEFVQKSGLTGLFCVDLAQCDGELYFFEMNLRMGGSCYGVTMAGANLPGALADAVYHNKALVATNGIRENVQFLSELIEIDNYQMGLISHSTLWQHLKGGQRRFIKSDEDPKPWRKWIIRSIRGVLARRAKGLIKRK